MCWGAEGRRAEAEEQASLDRVTKLLRERSDTAAVDALTRSETAWTTYRDAHCAAVAAVYESGSLGPMQQARCRTSLALERRQTIETLLTDAGR